MPFQTVFVCIAALLFCTPVLAAETCDDPVLPEMQIMSQDLSALVAPVGDLAADEAIQKFFDSLPACQAYEFVDPSWNGHLGTILDMESIETLEKAAGEVVRPTRFNKAYLSPFNRPVFGTNLKALASLLKDRAVNRVHVHRLREAAQRRYESAKASGEVGACFRIDTFGGYKYIFGPRRDVMPLSKEALSEIEALFGPSSPVREFPLSSDEKKWIDEKKLTVDELYELRALRRATQIFEKNTVMADDREGGTWNNFVGELTGNFQQNCTLEATTMMEFYKELRNRRLLRHFTSYREIKRMPAKTLEERKKDPASGGHVAVGMFTASGESVVVDTWFEKGGSPAHVLWESDWRELSLWRQNKFNDLVD